MAKITTCDGTGVEIPGDTPTTGFLGHQYSDEARVVADEYLAALSDLHTQSAAAFKTQLDELRARYRPQLHELPDDA